MKFKKKNALMLSLLAASIYAQSGTVSYPLFHNEITVNSEDGSAQFNGGVVSGPGGSPALARKQMTFLLPEDADLSTISVTLSDTQSVTLPGLYNLAAVGPTMVDTNALWPEGAEIVDGKDMEIYNKDAFYPQEPVKIVSVGNMWKYKLVTVEISPYKYNPVTQKLARYDSGFYTVGTAPSMAPMARLSAPAESVSASFAARMYSQVSKIAENKQPYNAPEAPATFGVRSAASGNSKYVIVTTNATEATSQQLSRFVSCKEAEGFDVDVITEDVWGGGTGDAAADNIRTWLKANYASSNIEYVLLIGDPTPASGDVPMKMVWPRYNTSRYTQYRDAPSDFYYSELSGNWDYDGDGIFGEYRDDYRQGGADKFPEVSVGRIPVYGNDIATLDGILAKTISYINSADISWRKNALLPMVPLDDRTPAYQIGEKVKNDFLAPNNYSSFRIYQEDYGVSPEMYPVSAANVRDTWKNDKFGYVQWMTHGSQTGASSVMYSSYTAELNDAYPSITFQGSCLNAYPENSGNLSYSILKNGGVASVAATRVSWYVAGETSYENASTIPGFSYNFAKNLIRENKSVGHSLAALKTRLTFSGDSRWMNWVVFGIYGDPSLKIGSAGSGVDTYSIESSVRSSDLPYSEWDANATYYGGDTVFLADTVWAAKWWSRNEVPGENMGPNKPWTFVRSSLPGGGTIDPLGTTIVNKGADQLYTVSPDNGVNAWTVFVDGSPIGNRQTYTFTNIQANHSIEVDFVTSYQNPWVGNKIYTSGDKVTFNGQVWQAKWWCSGIEPSDTSWGPWVLMQ